MPTSSVRAKAWASRSVSSASLPPPSGDLAALEGLVNEQADQIVRLTTITQNLLDRVRKLETTR